MTEASQERDHPLLINITDWLLQWWPCWNIMTRVRRGPPSAGAVLQALLRDLAHPTDDVRL